MVLSNRSITWIPVAALALAITACAPGDENGEPHMSVINEDEETPFERTCASDEVLAQQLAADPGMAERMQAIEVHTERFKNTAFATSGSTTIIPVVVHVLHNNATENISDAQIQSQIDVLNADFRRTNADADNTWSQAADTDIEFCWVGTSRTSTTETSFGTNDSIKFASQGGYDVYSPSTHMNMWVGDIGGGILGYAQFPGGSPSTDGIVIDYRYFGTVGTATAPFDMGRTATHEVGHYLNLRHIWGDGACGVDDFVSDTPGSDAANFGCAEGHVSCSSEDMVQNYMDYSDDSCMNLFTQGQKTRMEALFSGSRSGLATATCDPVDLGNPPPPPPPPSCDGAADCVEVEITFDNYPSETSWDIQDSSGATVASGSGGTAAATEVTVVGSLADGDYTFTINDSYGDGICCSYGSGSYTVRHADGTEIGTGGSFTSSASHAFTIGSGGGPGGGWTTLNSTDFESGWGPYSDGGSDAARVTSSYCASGICARLRDNTSTSVFTTTNSFNASAYSEMEVSFDYQVVSFEGTEDFWVQISDDGGSHWRTVQAFVRGADFNNNESKSATVSITSGLTSTTKLRFRADASGNSDWVYIDNVTVRAR